MSGPHASEDGTVFADDADTQEIPVVEDDVDGGAAQTGRRAGDDPTAYPILPSDAFAPAPRRRGRFVMVAAAGAVALGVVVGGAAWQLTGSRDTVAAAVADEPGPGSVPADEACPTRVDGKVTTGRDAGGTDSGPGVIKAFNAAYYNLRSAAAVSEFVLPAARQAVIPSIENLQQAIDALPPATAHCLTITELDDGWHRVDLAQFDPAPGGDRITFHQLIQTTREDGRWLIVSNTAVD
ncbi:MULTISPECIES: hypothetical protein [Gordonia]|uniref:hypothetical protein n=1 Tax=Gordonia TaxID=2053 RepID=UPI003267E4AE